MLVLKDRDLKETITLADLKFSLLSGRKEILESKEKQSPNTQLINGTVDGKVVASCFVREFVSIEKLRELTRTNNNKLFLKAEFGVIVDFVYPSKSKTEMKIISMAEEEKRSEILNDIEKNQFADCEFACLDGNVKASRILLAAASKVFAAMFTHETRDKKDGPIEVKDVKKPVMQQIVTYCSSGYLDIEKVGTNLNEKFMLVLW